ncbi:MAG: hypothetical protein ACI9IP_001076 [Arcticibacterium sp.]|jgi:hypothetical protein
MLPSRNFEEKITYYFGAGASANFIPMVSQINLRLKDFNTFLSNSQNEINNRVFIFRNSGFFHEFNDFCQKWIALVNESSSIDTLPKRLSDQARTKEYLEYKAFLVVLFNYFQYAKRKKKMTNI